MSAYAPVRLLLRTARSVPLLSSFEAVAKFILFLPSCASDQSIPVVSIPVIGGSKKSSFDHISFNSSWGEGKSSTWTIAALTDDRVAFPRSTASYFQSVPGSSLTLKFPISRSLRLARYCRLLYPSRLFFCVTAHEEREHGGKARGMSNPPTSAGLERNGSGDGGDGSR
jgi:hypothetical protein